MLKELFEASFYCTFPKKEDKVLMLDERMAEGDFSLVDTKACQGCKYVCSDNPDEREQLKVHGDGQVNIMSLDQMFDYVREDVGEISDYLLDGTESAVVVEMTCSTTDYVKGKRVKARGQLYNTLSLLNSNPDVRNHLEKKNSRYVVFSWKETFPENQEMDSVEKSMKGMILMSDEVYSPDNESKFDFGFKMKEIRYPDVLII
jgi:hypothetical protein